MQIDIGLAVVIAAVLFFYLRLIIIQRERVRQAKSKPQSFSKKTEQSQVKNPAAQYSILSRSRRDWIIAGAGAVLIFISMLLKIKAIPLPLAQAYWWIPAAIGIVAFSWGFK